MNEILQQLCTVRRVHNFRMELHAVIFALLIRNNRVGRIRRRADDGEAIRQRGHTVAMAHPDLMAGALGPYAGKERTVFLHIEKSTAELAIMAAFHVAAKLGAHGLLAITNAENRNTRIKNSLRRTRRTDIGR
ncbi:Uncharacterised protein [Brucella suis]|nr:Uncharacterised protein [Brucella suis]